MHRFVLDRLISMHERPLSWGLSKESFGLQLVLLVDILYRDRIFDTGKLMALIFGPGNTVNMERLDETWARERVELTRSFINNQLQPGEVNLEDRCGGC